MNMMILLLALLIGIVAGLRAMTAPAAISWAAHLGWLHLGDSWLAFLGYAFTPWIFTALAIVELVTDQLPSTPSRKVPVQFGTRIVMGALCGAAVGISGGWALGGAVAGVIGAGIGTLAGANIRGRLARSFGQDRPAAIIEDVVAIVAAFLIVAALP
ncbi:putative membrane protein [Phyllobacterium trifolii]|uniref:Putative membrane protein n=2 Tax=Phyllobacterium trifolii TaxID=300193 RepID=A0A839U659_9HYPH|nr:putative membrane protein [Phyllobacterium trifolii]